MTRHSPSKRSKGEALLHFCVSVVLLSMMAGCLYLFVIRYDFAGHLPRVEKTKNQPVLIPLESISTLETSFPTPTPVPVIKPTPIPASAYSQRVKISQPLSQDIECNVNLTEYMVETYESGTVLALRGWGYIEQQDAARSAIYIAICVPSIQQIWFYKTTITPGATGIEHDDTTGTNLDQSDFMAAVNVSDYPDGQYTLGLVILNESGEQSICSFVPLKEQYAFHVKQGNIVSHKTR